MNQRERYIETLRFGSPDRIFLSPGSGRKSTREAWRTQGLPDFVGKDEISAHAFSLLGSPHEWSDSVEHFAVNERMIPQFDQKILEEKERTRIVQDWKGNICEISNEFGPEYLLYAIDFVTRRWIKCPVESRDDWEAMKERYDPDDPSRYPPVESSPERDPEKRQTPLILHFSGPFWQMREWLGFERLCTSFYDDPHMIRDMVVFWTEHVARLMEKSFEIALPDEVHLSEDMAYKAFPMISPDMAREFLFPAWKTWGDMVKSRGIPIYGMDSDGYVGSLIPLWIEAGINVCDPMEVAAHNDIVALREEFGTKMAFKGGVDKRKMARGGKELDGELARIIPVVESGGYIPSCDHGIPADVSWPNYLRYFKGLARLTHWL